MRTLPPAMAGIIAAGDFQGDQRAVSRVTVQKVQLGLYPYKDQVYASIPFTASADGALEMPNLQSVSWERSVDSQVGTCSFEINNVDPLVAGQPPPTDGSFDGLGAYSFNRAFIFRPATDRFDNVLVPDRMVRLYQGYGVDYSVFPENDPHMVLMGLYLIDDVTYTADGRITVECRDIGRLLADQIMFPPVVPFKKYPLKFTRNVVHPAVTTPGTTVTTTTGQATQSAWVKPTYETDSGVPYNGINGVVYGHHGTDAFDASDSTYWLSVGNSRPAAGYAFEYIQGKFNAKTLFQARCVVWGGPYRVYLSVKVGNTWQGRAVVPYDPNNPASAPNGANVPYVASMSVARDGVATFNFPPIPGATAVRFCFTNLYNSGLGPYPYRAGVRRVEVRSNITATSTTTTTTSLTTVPAYTTGDYGDYSDIVRRLLAYGGFYWPQDGVQTLTGNDITTHTETYHFASSDPFLILGRIWGDIQDCGTTGQADLGVEIWDKKPLLDGINYVREIIGFIFYIDEQGAAQFRMPNLFSLGNWQTDVNGLGRTRATAFTTIGDDEVILSLSAKLSSRNLREKVFVGNVPGKIAAVANGRIPNPANFRRVGGWSDQHFASVAEAQVMADFITLRQLFTFRENQFRIPADPSLQCDDQVLLVERTTGESYQHYIKSISSSWDAATGEWTYDVASCWLGVNPLEGWAFRRPDLSAETQAYLDALGA